MIKKRYCTLLEFSQKHNLNIGDLLYKMVNEEIDAYVFYSGDGKWTAHLDGESTHKDSYSAGLFKLSPIQLVELELKGAVSLVFLLPSPGFSHNLLSTACPIKKASQSPEGMHYFSPKESLELKKEELVIISEDYSKLVEEERLKNTLDTESLLQKISELEKTPYLDHKHTYFAPELALAIDIWNRLFIKKEGNPKHGTERQVEKLLNVTMEGEISQAMIKRLGAVVNPKPASFVKKKNNRN